MKMTLLKTCGASETISADTAVEVERAINAHILDVVDLQNGSVMFVDDNGWAKSLPNNLEATKLYLSICRAGASGQIKGDVVIAKMNRPINLALSQHSFEVLKASASKH